MSKILGVGVALLALTFATAVYAGEEMDTGSAMKSDNMKGDMSDSDGMSSDTDSMDAMEGEPSSGTMEKGSGDHMMADPDEDKSKM